MPTSRLHVIESGASAWLVLIGGPDADAVAALEQQASALLVGADLPDWTAADGAG